VRKGGHDELRLLAAGLGEIISVPVAGTSAGERGAFAVRPEQLHIVAGAELTELDNHFQGTVRDYLYLGDVTVYKIALDNGVVLEALLANSLPGPASFLERGEPVGVGWRLEAGVFLHD
jgi:spermidine/putrescine transport system ATP-binding protein